MGKREGQRGAHAVVILVGQVYAKQHSTCTLILITNLFRRYENDFFHCGYYAGLSYLKVFFFLKWLISGWYKPLCCALLPLLKKMEEGMAYFIILL